MLEAPGLSRAAFACNRRLRLTAHVDSHTSIVIEGFPRSANTYAAACFRYANPSARVVSHSHVFRTVRRAARHGVPAIVLVRDPREALASAMQFDGNVRPSAAIDHYHGFYRRAMAYRDAFLLVRFEEATSDFGAVIRRCNDVFGTSFAEYVPTPAAEDDVRRTMDRWTEAAWAGAQAIARYTRPTPERRSVSATLAALGQADRRALAGAVELYRSVLDS